MEYSKDQFNCPVEATLFLIGGKYKPPHPLVSDRKTAPLHGAATYDPESDTQNAVAAVT